jgi:hypothetical protein
MGSNLKMTDSENAEKIETFPCRPLHLLPMKFVRGGKSKKIHGGLKIFG